LSDHATDALEPYVGRIVAETCIGATAISLGKTREDLSAEDLPALKHNIRNLLASVAPKATIEALITDLERSLA
jgi:hypothetical protein